MPDASGIFADIVTDDFGVSFHWHGPDGFRHARYDEGGGCVRVLADGDRGEAVLAVLPITGQRLDPVSEAEDLVTGYIREHHTRRQVHR